MTGSQYKNLEWLTFWLSPCSEEGEEGDGDAADRQENLRGVEQMAQPPDLNQYSRNVGLDERSIVHWQTVCYGSVDVCDRVLGRFLAAVQG